MKTLIMLSGGLDSTYTLAKILQDTEDEVFVHHVHLLTNGNKHVKEAESCKAIVEYCRKNMRDFSYSETAIDHRRLLAHGYDLLSIGLEAGVVAGSYHLVTHKEQRIDRWLVGYCLEEELAPRRLKLAQEICAMNCERIVKPPTLELLESITQLEQVEYLPSDLCRLTWSCPRPTEGENGVLIPCGECNSCRRLAALAKDGCRFGKCQGQEITACGCGV